MQSGFQTLSHIRAPFSTLSPKRPQGEKSPRRTAGRGAGEFIKKIMEQKTPRNGEGERSGSVKAASARAMPSFQRRGAPWARCFNKSFSPAYCNISRFPPTGPKRAGRGGTLQLHDAMPEPHKCASRRSFPPMPREAVLRGGVRTKKVGDDYISDCGLFCCQFAACAEEEKMYCWKALSATPVTSMPACSCASRMALVVLPPKMPSALSSR